MQVTIKTETETLILQSKFNVGDTVNHHVIGYPNKVLDTGKITEIKFRCLTEEDVYPLELHPSHQNTPRFMYKIDWNMDQKSNHITWKSEGELMRDDYMIESK